MNPLETIKNILEIINPVLEKDMDEKNNFPKGFTFFNVLENVQFNLESIQTLAKENIAKHDHAIGLISRNLLSDFIVTGFIIKLSKSEDDLIGNLYSLYNSDLKKMDSFLQMFKDAGFLDEEEFERFNEKYLDNRHIYKVIRDYANENNLNKFPSTRSIIEKFLSSDQNDPWTSQILNSYDIWVCLSKYEHLGWNSYDLTRNTNTKRANGRLSSVLFKTLILIGSCLETLGEMEALERIFGIMKKHKEESVQ